MKHVITTIVLASFIALSGLAAEQEFFWRDERGQPMPDTEARKSERGFGGWLLITAEKDWQAKWAGERATPVFKRATSLRFGETVEALIFIGNPLPNGKGIVDVRCDFRVTQPDGRISMNERNVTCLEGPLVGDPFHIRLAKRTLELEGEPGDPAGTWVFEVTLRDVERGTALKLRETVELVGGG